MRDGKPRRTTSAAIRAPAALDKRSGQLKPGASSVWLERFVWPNAASVGEARRKTSAPEPLYNVNSRRYVTALRDAATVDRDAAQ
jgi:hypothetical protein